MDAEIKELQKRVGLAVRDAREKKGWSQTKLAELADLSQRHLQQIEDGSVNPSIGMIYRVFSVLGLSVDAIFYPDTSDFGMDMTNVRIKYQFCTSTERKILVNTADYIASQFVESHKK